MLDRAKTKPEQQKTPTQNASVKNPSNQAKTMRKLPIPVKLLISFHHPYENYEFK